MYRASGKAKGNFLSDYGRSRTEGVYRTIDSTPVASKLIELLEDSFKQQFSGTIGALYEELNRRTHPKEVWPKSAKGFGSVLRRLAPSLRTLGYKIELDEKRRKDGYHCLIPKVRETVEMSSSETWIDNDDESLFEGDNKKTNTNRIGIRGFLMEVAKVYSELTGKGLYLVTHEGKIRVWPKEK